MLKSFGNYKLFFMSFMSAIKHFSGENIEWEELNYGGFCTGWDENLSHELWFSVAPST